MKTQKEFFNIKAENWDEKQNISVQKCRKLIKECQLSNDRVVLDVGTGTGVLIPFLLAGDVKELKIYAIDYAEKMIEKLLSKNYPKIVIPMVADIHNTNFEDNTFDRIIANACYPHFEKKEVALNEIYRILKKGGFFIISHLWGREHINRFHKKTHQIVSKDMIPSIPELKSFIEGLGFKYVDGIDETDYFFVKFTK